MGTTLAGALLFAALAVLVNAQRPTTYSADSLVVVEAEGAVDGGVPIAAVWAQVATSETVLAPLATDIGRDVEELRDALTVTPSDTAPLISFTATATDRERAAAWANASADALLARASAEPIAGFTLRQATEAIPPSESDTDYGPYLVVGLAVVGGLVGLAIGRHLLSRRHS